ncbi:MAG TPA: hypothetical protein VNT32_11570 [Thermoleophilaceae bacterium]|nr:hypothetical protein [Thermoleophilaceae bacterium]
MIVLTTLGAPQRRMLERRRRPRATAGAEPEPVPTARATLARAAPLPSPSEASAWLDGLREDRGGLRREADEAVAALNSLLRAHRACAADPYARDVSVEHALRARVGYGSGDHVAEGRVEEAVEVPREAPRESRQDRLSPQERLAAVLGGRVGLLACEELVLRARADLDAGRHREAALQARIALEAALAELDPAAAGVGELGGRRAAIGQAANEALAGEPGERSRTAVEEAVALLERALRRRRLADVRDDV